MNEGDAKILAELKDWLSPPNDLDHCQYGDLEAGIALIERLTADNARLAAEVEGWKRAEEASKRADRVTDVLIRKQREKIASLNAQVERLTPRKMNAEEVCEVLNRHESRPGCWHESDGAISLLQFLRPGMLERVGQIGLREARYIAQGLLRDAGPIVVQEPPKGEGEAE